MPENSPPEGRGSDSDGTDAPPAGPKKAYSTLHRILFVLAIVGSLGATATAVGMVLLYRAATAGVPEYEALLVDLDAQQASGELDRERQELESQIAALYSEAQKEPRWQTVVTADQLNGWLAVQLPIDFPELEEQGIRQPRVMLKEGEAMLACQATVEGVDSVVSITVEPVVAEDGWVGFAAQSIKIGRLPLPTTTLMEIVEQAIEAEGPQPDTLRYRWGEDQDKPVLLFDVEQLASTPEQVRRIDTLQVREGQLLLGGATEDRKQPSAEGVLDQPE